MKKVTKEQIDTFLADKKIAVAGASRNPQKFGCQVLNSLKKNGYQVLPINPNAEEILGVKCYNEVNELPKDVDSLLILTPKAETDKVLVSAIKKGIKNIWVQQSAHTEETLKIAEEYEKEIIHGKCIFMFAEPVQSIHKFHRTIVKIFGGLPKPEQAN